ncbi:hypothetical protein K1W54_11120 [Micromonospora sp. CPCC 205371]|nr:hypothetical protein [Micromonospora sp. CPCC 205371]
MKIYTEFVVLHANVPMPDEETFCPSFWKVDDFDADGDYYARDIGGRWSSLKLAKRSPDGPDSVLTVGVLREERPYDPGLQEILDLQRFLDFHRAGRYHAPALSDLDSRAVTSLAIETADLADYREFLETVRAYLAHAGGVVVSPWELDEDEFAAEFLTATGLDGQ